MARAEKNHEKLKTIVTAGATFAGLLLISNFSFRTDVANFIRKRDQGKCVRCGDTGQLVAHYDHQNDNDSTNGVLVCVLCEAIFHVQNAFDPERINMDPWDALTTAKHYISEMAQRRSSKNRLMREVSKNKIQAILETVDRGEEAYMRSLRRR